MNIRHIKQNNENWVSVNDILNSLETEITNGNVHPKGFSAAIFLSDLKKEIKKVSNNE